MPQVNPAPALPWGREEGGVHEVSRQDTAVAAREGSGDRSPDSKRRRVDDEAAPHAIGEVVPHEEHEEEEAGPGLQLSDIGVKVGHRIEVKWEITDEESGNVDVRWWGAKVLGAAPADDSATTSPGSSSRMGHSYQILYDAWGEFDPETANVRFLDGYQLFDMGCAVHPEGFLRWRAEGDLRDESDEEEEGLADPRSLVTMAELHEEVVGDPEAQEAEQQAMEELSALPWERQQHIAAGFREMVDRVKEGLGAIVSSGDGTKTVTAQDIKNIFSGIRPSNS